jgi:hypothetical protein
MTIEPKEIDPIVQNALKERLAQIFAAPTALDPVAARVRSAGMQRWRETARRYAANFWAAGGSLAASLLALPIVGPTSEGAAALLFVLLNGLGVGLVIRGMRKTQQELTRFVSPDLMRGAAQIVALTRAEQLYCEAVAALIDAGPLLGEPVQQEILRQLNESLQYHRRLSVPIQQQHAASGGASIAGLEQELANLAARRATVADDSARALLDQSIALCARRLESARVLEPAREKAEAQQELILQTLASVQGSLARTATASTEPAAAEVDALQQSVTQMNHQARAVEEAVAEVMALRG